MITSRDLALIPALPPQGGGLTRARRPYRARCSMTAPTTSTTTSTATSAAPATRRGPDPERIRHSGPECLSLRLPLLGTIELSRPELAYVGGILGLSALGLLEWPIALVIAGGHVLSADRSSRTVRDLGEAMTQA